MKKIYRVDEAEVVAEFLKNEFHQTEYHLDRHQFENVVLDGDLTDPEQNRQRRELLFRRHRFTWMELPQDVEWWRAELTSEDLPGIRVFPRGHWPKMAAGHPLTVMGLVESIRSNHFSNSTMEDVSMIQAMSYRLRNAPDASSVILIGTDEQSPTTVLEGNHRMIAAVLATEETARQNFTVYLGASPQMNRCYWHRPTTENLVGYLRKRAMCVADAIRGKLFPARVPGAGEPVPARISKRIA